MIKLFRTYNEPTIDPLIEQLDELLTDFDFSRICSICRIAEEPQEVSFEKDRVIIGFIGIEKSQLIIDQQYDIYIRWINRFGNHLEIGFDDSVTMEIWEYLAKKILLLP